MASLIFETKASASYDGLNYAGLLVGSGISSRGAEAQFTGGIEAGVQMSSEFGLGAVFLRLNSLASRHQKDSEFYTVALEGTYFANSILQGMRFGVRTGVSYSSDSTFAPTTGVLAGYDYALGDGFSIGGEASTLSRFVTPWEQTFQLLVAGRYWF